MSLPHYERPPVVETILGIQFDPIPEMRTAHLGAFWASLGDEWPTPEDAAYLEPQFERFDNQPQWGELAFRLRLADIKSRVRIRNRAKDRMIQIQNGRFILNWLGASGTPYPRYDAIKDEFLHRLNEWKTFLESTFDGKIPAANQWEVTYLNHIPKGTVWNTPADWDFCRLWGRTHGDQSSLHFESASAEWHFVIPERIGRLHINWRHVAQNDAHELVRLDLTARGPCTSAEWGANQIVEGLDHGHIAIVTAFRDMMNPSANSTWGLSDAC